MPTLCAICRETYGSCAACKRADALPMPEAKGFAIVNRSGAIYATRSIDDSPGQFTSSDISRADLWWPEKAPHTAEDIYTASQLRAARLEGARAAVEAMGEYAKRYRWLRDESLISGQVDIDENMVWCVFGRGAADCRPVDGHELDSHIDAGIAAVEFIKAANSAQG